MTRRTLGLLALAMGVAGWTVRAPASPEPSPGSGDPPGAVLEVLMVDKGGGQWRFEPSEIVVGHGDVVRFVQADIVPHNVQFKDVPDGTELGAASMGPFLLQKGDIYELPIDERFAPGVHRFVCTPHEMMGMAGMIEVRPGT